MTSEFNILNNFKGFGNPSGNFWFVGIEESLKIEPTKLPEIVADYKNGFLVVKPNEIADDLKKFGRSYTKVYDIMSKIIAGFQDLNWRKYRVDNLLQINSQEFQMNLYPLGKKTIKEWPHYYNELFHLQSFANYSKIVIEKRFPLLRNFRLKNNPLITICFGLSYIEDFKKAFDLNNTVELSYNNKQIFYYPEKRVIITPFFDNRNLGWKKINIIIDILKKIKQ
jgi:hypothetical protein